MGHQIETSIFAEDSTCGFWRLQSNEPALIEKMNQLAEQTRSPWKITGEALAAGSPWLYRRRFSSTTDAREAFTRILMRMDAEEFELIPVAVGLGWSVNRVGSNGKAAR
tara:strand:+ start:219 stop:545 length:327 start_codon:yes stop_codon:yes gene_type:complete